MPHENRFYDDDFTLYLMRNPGQIARSCPPKPLFSGYLASSRSNLDSAHLPGLKCQKSVLWIPTHWILTTWITRIVCNIPRNLLIIKSCTFEGLTRHSPGFTPAALVSMVLLNWRSKFSPYDRFNDYDSQWLSRAYQRTQIEPQHRLYMVFRVNF